MKIFIDPGHGGADPGAVNGSRHEARDVLRLALAVSELLEKRGASVQMSRTDNLGLNLNERTTMANNGRADFLLSLHRNSANSQEAMGIETWVHTAASSAALRVASLVQQKLCAVATQANRGVRAGDYHMLRESKMPAILVELGFISNATDNTLFDQFFDKYAAAIAEGICEAFEIAAPVVLAAELPLPVHWAETDYNYLTQEAGITIGEKRYNDNITRGEVFALLARTIRKTVSQIDCNTLQQETA